MAPRGPRDPNSLRRRLRNNLPDIISELGGVCKVEDARNAFARLEGKVEADYGTNINGGNNLYFDTQRAIDDLKKEGRVTRPSHGHIALNREWVAPTAKVTTKPYTTKPVVEPVVVEPVVEAVVEAVVEPVVEAEVEPVVEADSYYDVGDTYVKGDTLVTIDAKGREWETPLNPVVVEDTPVDLTPVDLAPVDLAPVMVEAEPVVDTPVIDDVEPVIDIAPVEEAELSDIEGELEILFEDDEKTYDIKSLNMTPCSIKLKNGGEGNYLTYRDDMNLVIATPAKKGYVVVNLETPSVEFESEKQRKIFEGGLTESRWVVKCLVFCKEKCNHTNDFAGFQSPCTDTNCPLKVWSARHVG